MRCNNFKIIFLPSARNLYSNVIIPRETLRLATFLPRVPGVGLFHFFKPNTKVKCKLGFLCAQHSAIATSEMFYFKHGHHDSL